jgi:stage III sporulation protein AG
MFKNLNEKDKKKIYSLLAIITGCVVLIIALSSMPGSSKSSSKDDKKEVASQESKDMLSEEQRLEARLESTLTNISGVGKVDVLITFETGEQIEPAFNSNSTTEKTEEKDSQGGERAVTTESVNKTMVTSNSENPIVIKTTDPKIKGVLVVAEGASDPTIKESLYKAVQTSLQISGHQVEVYSK